MILSAVLLSSAASAASNEKWDGYVGEEGAVKSEETVLVNMNLLSSITAANGAPSSKICKNALYTCRWTNHTAVGQINFKVPRDWSGIDKIKIPIYSAVATHAQLTIVIECDYVPSPTAKSSYFSYITNINWTGWKDIEIDPYNDMNNANKASLEKVRGLKFSADGWGGIPDERSDLYFDTIVGIKGTSESDDGESSIGKTYSAAEINAFKDKLGSGAALYNYSGYFYKDGKSAPISESGAAVMLKNQAVFVPAEFWKNAFSAEISENGDECSINIGSSSAVFKAGEEVDGCAPFVKNNVFYVPLEASAKRFGMSFSSAGMLSVVAAKDTNAISESDIMRGIGAYLACPTAIDPKTVTENDYTLLKNKYRQYLLGDENNDLNDELVQMLIRKIDSAADSACQNINLDPSATVLFGDKNVEVTADMGVQYRYMWNMARAYGTYGSKYYKNPTIKSNVMYSLEWLYNHYYGQAEIDGTGWRDIRLYNWWDWYINVPGYLMNTLFVFEPQMLQTEIEKYLSPFEYMRKEVFRTQNNVEDAQSRSKVVTLSAILHENTELMNECMRDFNLMLQTVERGNGVYEDGSYILHSVYPQEGSYAADLLVGRFMDIASILAGTKFEITSPQKYNQMMWMNKVFRPVMYNGTVFNRNNGRYPESSSASASVIVKGALELLGSFGEEDDKILKDIIRENCSEAGMKNVINTLDNMSFISKLREVMNEENDGNGKYIYGQMRYNTDIAVQHRENYAASLAMSSSRIGIYESIGQCNKKGWYQGDGALWVYNDKTTPTNDQFGRSFFSNANMYRIPGTTEDTQERQAVSVHPAYLPAKDFVGGTDMDDKYVAAAFDFEAYHYEDIDTTVDDGNGGGFPQHFSDLTAKKSYFMFDDEIVSLGSDIKSTNNANVNTYVDNRELYKQSLSNPDTADSSGMIYGAEDIVVDSNTLEKQAEITKNYTNPSYVYLEGFGGYYFPSGGDVTINKTGNENSFFEIWLNHGLKPNNAKYAYVMLPGKNVEECAQYAASPNILIKRCDKDVHSVFDKSTNITATVFWSAGSEGDIEATEPMVLMTKENGGKLDISVSDPTRKLNSAKVIIKGNLTLLSADERITAEIKDGKTTLTINFASAGGKTLKAELQ